jgi:hypothetical protein
LLRFDQGFEREPEDNGERLIWLEPHVLNKLRAPLGSKAEAGYSPSTSPTIRSGRLRSMRPRNPNTRGCPACR